MTINTKGSASSDENMKASPGFSKRLDEDLYENSETGSAKKEASN